MNDNPQSTRFLRSVPTGVAGQIQLKFFFFFFSHFGPTWLKLLGDNQCGRAKQ